MTILDWALIIILLIYILSGLISGLIYKLGSLIGTILAIVLAGRYYDDLARLLGDSTLVKVLAFIIIFIVVSQLLGLLFKLINKVFNLVAILPFLKSINRLGGAILGLVEGALTLGIIIYFVARILPESQALLNSDVSKFLIKIGNWVAPLLPEVVRKFQSLI